MVNPMKNKRCKSFLSSALLACTLMAPGIASADPIEYVFDITYEGVDDSLFGLGAQSIYGFGEFSFFSETVIDFTSDFSLYLDDIAPSQTLFNASFYDSSNYNEPSLLTISTVDFSGVGLTYNNSLNQIYFMDFSNDGLITDGTFNLYQVDGNLSEGPGTETLLGHTESGSFQLEYAEIDSSGNLTSAHFISADQGSTLPFYLMTLSTDGNGTTPDNGSGTPIPEPAAWALLLVGLGTLLTRKRA